MKIRLVRGRDFLWRVFSCLVALIGSLVVADFVADSIISYGINVATIIAAILMVADFYMVWLLLKDFAKHHIRRTKR